MSLPSAMQSTSTSVASSRKRSTRTGRSGLTSTAVRMYAAQIRLGRRRSPWRGRQARRTDARGPGSRPCWPRRRPPPRRWRCRRRSGAASSLSIIAAKCLRSSAISMLLRLGSDDGHTSATEGRAARFSGVWPPNWTIGGVALLALVDIEHVLEGEGLEEELVARVVVGGNGLGIRVHHDGLKSFLLQREGGMDAAVVEFDALADAVGTAAEDHHLLLGALAGLILVAVGRVKIGRGRLELGGAGVDQPVGGLDACGFASVADGILGGACDVGELTIGESELLGPAQIDAGGILAEGLLLLDEFLDVVEEPRVDCADLVDLLRR